MHLMGMAAEQREWAEHASKALALAGAALDPNQQRGPCLPLGRLLLEDAFVAAARAISGEGNLNSVSAAFEGLKDRCASSQQLSLPQELDDAVTVLQSQAPLHGHDLRRAELAVALLVELAGERDVLRRAKSRCRGVFALLAVLVAAFVTFSVLVLREPWANYEWTTSSATGGFMKAGTLGFTGSYGLLFHTNQEKDPWVIVDLLSTRSIENVLVKNRLDCCQFRGLPLVLEYAGEDRKFKVLGTRKKQFQVWESSFAPVQARYVRLRVVGSNILHLHAIQIR